MTPRQLQARIGATVAAAIVLAAAFMPWGEIQGAPRIPFEVKGPPGMPAFPGGDPFGGTRIVLTVTGWNGKLTFGGLELPNWLVVLAAAGACLVAWLGSAGGGAAPRALAIALGAYGAVHSILFLGVLIAASEGSPGIGVVLTALAFVGMIVASLAGSRHSQTESVT